MDETTDNIDREDSIGSSPFAHQANTISDGTGIRNASMTTDGLGGWILAEPSTPASGEVTLAVHFYLDSGSGQNPLGRRVGGAGVVRIVYAQSGSSSTLICRVVDDTTSSEIYGIASFESFQNDAWYTAIFRVDENNLTADFRLYGFSSGNATTIDMDVSGPWDNAHPTFEIQCGSQGAGSVDEELDEVLMWDRLLTDGECDALGAGALPD
jgi:hypothetical protein